MIISCFVDITVDSYHFLVFLGIHKVLRSREGTSVHGTIISETRKSIGCIYYDGYSVGYVRCIILNG